MNVIDKNTKIAVIGAGQMGSGISQVLAMHGYKVKVRDISERIFETSQKRIISSLQKLESKKLVSEPIDIIRERISFYENIDELIDCEIFIESAFENFAIKEDIFHKLSKILKPTSLVASNTSSYSITALSKLVPYPEKFIGFHFMNPPPIMQLVEVIRGKYTDDETFSFFFRLANELGKNPIISKDSPGFVLNRILIPMINEAIYVLDEGISTPNQIDAAMKFGANHPIGPLALADLIGLDTVLAILKTLQKELGKDKYAPCSLLENYVSKKWLGKKTKKGFYEYK